MGSARYSARIVTVGYTLFICVADRPVRWLFARLKPRSMISARYCNSRISRSESRSASRPP